MNQDAAPRTPADLEGRRRKAEQFALAAQAIHEVADGDSELDDDYVTLCVHAGIAAADVICMRRLDRYSRSKHHDDAAALLAQVDRALGKHLADLLGMKSRAGYSTLPVRARDVTRAARAMQALIDAAR